MSNETSSTNNPNDESSSTNNRSGETSSKWSLTYLWASFKIFCEDEAKYIFPILAIFAPAAIFFIPIVVRNPENVQIILSGMNIVALLVWLKWGNRRYELELKEDDTSYKNYVSELRIQRSQKSHKEIAQENSKYVNALVGELGKWIRYYAWSLIVVYSVFIIDSVISLRWEDSYNAGHPYIKIFEDIFNLLSALFLYQGFRVLYDKTHETIKVKDNIKAGETGKGLHDIKTGETGKVENDIQLTPPRYRKLMISAFALLCLVYVIYTITIQISTHKDKLPRETINEIYNASSEYVTNSNNTAANYLKKVNEITADYDSNKNANVEDPATKSIDEVIKSTDEFQAVVQKRAATRIGAAIEVYENNTKAIWPNIFGLFIGCVNALAMLLLFGRYISMEHLINETKEGNSYTYITIGAIYLLPVYALVQPLFGSFEIDIFGNRFAFANYVFSICFIGKAFFLWFTWYFMKDRAMHYYLHTVISFHGIPDELQQSFKQKSKLISKKEDEKNDAKTDTCTNPDLPLE